MTESLVFTIFVIFNSSAVDLNLSFEKAPRPGHIAFISQSGTFGADLAESAIAKGYGLSKFVSIGNQADLNTADYHEYLMEAEIRNEMERS